MNRILFCILTLLCTFHATAAHDRFVQDSLLHRLGTTYDAHLRTKIYRNLADLCFDGPEEKRYLHEMYRASRDAGDRAAAANALRDLTYAWIRSGERDSVFRYMRLLEQEGDPGDVQRELSYLRSRLFEANVRQGNGEMFVEDSLLNDIRGDKDNVYIKIERAFTTGSGLTAHDKFKEALPYLTSAYELARQLPQPDGYPYRALCTGALASACGHEGQIARSVALNEELLELHRSHYNEYLAKERPFYNIETRYIQCYASLLTPIGVLSDEKAERYRREMDALLAKTDDPFDKYSGFITANNRYLHERDWKNAARTNDSLIRYARIVAPYNIPGLHELQAQIYEMDGDYRKALEHEKIYTRMKDSISSAVAEQRLGKLQVEYDVDKLSFENSQLENRNKRILLIALAAFLLLAFAACIYLYHNLRHERRMKEMMRRLKVKAEESENMKTAFINSMCHEIRTPLNAIVGFSGILAGGTEAEESRQELAELITANANLLTTSIDHLLHVANLDASHKPLARAATDLGKLCRRELEACTTPDPSVAYRLEIPRETLLLSTNEHYLGLVIRNLLDNAAKFTDEGTITLGFHVDPQAQQVVLYVRDTGCGIPAEQREAVFDRFTKLDTFKQGNGIGLYLCRLIVTRLSGRIYADPTYTDGACIVIRLPL